MKRTGKIAYCLGGITLLICVLTIFSAWAYSEHESHRASALIASLNELRIGTPTESFGPIFSNAGGKRFSTPAQPSSLSSAFENSGSHNTEQWGIYFGLPYRLNVFIAAHPALNTSLGFFAIHPWMVQASVTTKDSKAALIDYRTVVQLPGGERVMSVVHVGDAIEFSADGTKYRIGLPSLRNKIPYLDSYISADLSQGERTKLAAHNLECLGTRRGCLSPADIAPGLWRAYSLQAKNND